MGAGRKGEIYFPCLDLVSSSQQSNYRGGREVDWGLGAKRKKAQQITHTEKKRNKKLFSIQSEKKAIKTT